MSSVFPIISADRLFFEIILFFKLSNLFAISFKDSVSVFAFCQNSLPVIPFCNSFKYSFNFSFDLDLNIAKRCPLGINKDLKSFFKLSVISFNLS
uniref:Uncharacterized protein n=1 Tax=Borreliella burgdorferi TaxID=139 RepID=Q9ZIZ0_BORBG|nr:unknown [Borreliella burgdorferi N40]